MDMKIKFEPLVVPQLREECISLCELAEETNRYQDMVALMRHVTSFEQELTVDERNYFSVAYKELVGLHRKSLRNLADLHASLLPEEGRQRELVLGLQARVRNELVAVCEEALSTIEHALIPRSVLTESTVYYHKMTADYLRYLAEFSAAEERQRYADRAGSAYQRARELASQLGATNPVRLGLSLNMSVFEFEIKADVQTAMEVATHALVDASEDMDDLLDVHRKDALLIIGLLKDNMRLWSSTDSSSSSRFGGSSVRVRVELNNREDNNDSSDSEVDPLLKAASQPVDETDA